MHIDVFTTAPGNNARKCDKYYLHSAMRFCIQSGSTKGYKEAKEYANKVKQCCEVYAGSRFV